MKQRAFLTALVVALAVAFGVVWIKNRSRNEPPPAPVPAQQSSAPSDSTCLLTECRIVPVITPALSLMSEGKPLVGIWNVARSSQTIMEMKNVSEENIKVSGLTLSMCLNEHITPIVEVPEGCRYVKVARSDYEGKSMTLKPGETCATTLETDAHGQIARLQFDTTRGPVILMVTVQ